MEVAMKTLLTLLLEVAVLLIPFRGAGQSTIPWSAFSSGFAVSTSPTSLVKSSVGEVCVGPMQGATSSVVGGFLGDTLLSGSTIRQATVGMNSGWNLISIPLRPANSSVATLFPGAASEAFAYSEGYIASATLSPAKGYWLKMDAVQNFAISGIRLATRDVSVVTGWNMIGLLETAVSTSAITTVPAGIVSSGFFGYQRGYFVASTLSPGKGYWVNASNAGVLQLGGGTVKQVVAGTTPSEAWTRIIVESKDGMVGVLYLAKAEEMKGNYELPPIPPAGVFDARFSSNTNTERTEQENLEIQLQSASYPLKVTAQNLNGRTLRLKDAVSGRLFNATLQEGKPLVVSQRLEKLILQQTDVPKEFALSQNFPNPFNPTTVIRYALPTKSFVRLTVYNTLGQVVRVIVNADADAGYHEVEFDASGMASGVYLYRLTAGSYVDTKRLIVVR
jgi:hypothetical protein